MPLIGLDIGTTGCKCTVFDYEGNINSYAYKEYSIECPSPGRFELNPLTVWDGVKEVIVKALDGKLYTEATAIAVSSFGESAVPVDRNGNILYNSILYTDSRGSDEIRLLEKKLGARKIMSITGLPVHSMYTLGKLMWVKKHLPDLHKNTWKYLLYQDFIVYRLTGLPVIDYSLASRTMAFHVISKQWDASILDEAGISPDVFSEPKPSGVAVEKIKKEIAQELGLPLGTLVVTGGHDQACAALGAGIINENEAVDGIGTADCITTSFCRPVLNDIMLQNNFNCEPHIIEDRYISLSFTLSGGSLLKWYRDNFAQVEASRVPALKKSVYQLLDEKASKEPTGMLVLPHFCGSGTPYMDTESKGAVIGLTLETTSSQFYRSLLEGVAYEIRYNIECLAKAGVKVKKLRAVGGGAKSALWLQIKADVMNIPVETLNINEAGTLATAILAGKAAGIYTSCKQAIERFLKVKQVFYPNNRNNVVYEELYEKHKRVYAAVKGVLENN